MKPVRGRWKSACPERCAYSKSTYATGATYHPNGALAEFTYGNGIVHTMSRNLRQLPERSRSALGTNVVLDDSYDYDANGNVAAISDGLAGGPGDRDMSYDALDRLAGVVAGPAQGGNGSFAYDPLDNLRVLDQGSRQFRYHYDASNRLAQIKSPTGALLHSFGYDARGNTTSKDSGTLSFDRENRLTHSALPMATTYVYDGLGRRVAEASPVSTYFYYSHEGKLLYTNDHKTQANTDHIYLSGSLVAARKVAFGSNPTITVTYQHTDALGSPVAFTDASGNVTRRERMTAWGEPADGTWSNEPGYTGHQMDAGSKLVYMQQRYYDPSIGTFYGADPVGAGGGSLHHFNRYRYANANPYRLVDPDGRAAQSAPGGFCAMVRVCNYGHKGRPGDREPKEDASIVTKAYLKLHQRLDAEFDKDPKAVPKLSNADIAIIANYMVMEAKKTPLDADFIFKLQLADTFIYHEGWGGKFFDVEGVGRAEGGNINYIGVGAFMARAYFTPDQAAAAVVVWNAYQFGTGEGPENIRQMASAQPWMMVGYLHYWRHHEKFE